MSDVYEDRLREMEDRLLKLEVTTAERHSALVEKISDLRTTIWWLIGVVATGMGSVVAAVVLKGV